MGTVGFLLALKGLRSASLRDRVNLQSLKSLLRTPGPLRAAILSLATLAAGVLGLVVAYGVVPSESVAAQSKSNHTAPRDGHRTRRYDDHGSHEDEAREDEDRARSRSSYRDRTRWG